MNTAVGSTPPPPDTTAPSVPTGLAATGAIGKVTLNWTASTDNVGVSGYGVYRDGTRIATAPGTTYVDNGRPAGTYAYTVRAEDAAGNASAQTARGQRDRARRHDAAHGDRDRAGSRLRHGDRHGHRDAMTSAWRACSSSSTARTSAPRTRPRPTP